MSLAHVKWFVDDPERFPLEWSRILAPATLVGVGLAVAGALILRFLVLRIDEELLREISWSPSERPLVYVCGSTAFVERAADLLVTIGHEAGRIRTERFGPTGT